MCSVQFVKTEIVCDFSIHYKMLSKQKGGEKETRCSCLPIVSNLHPFKIFWHLVLYSSAIANPRCPVSTRLDETCFPTDFCSLLYNSTFFLLTANGHISPHCLLHHHLAGETVLSLGVHTFCLATEPLPNRMYNSYVLPASSSKLAPIVGFFLHRFTDFYKTCYQLRISPFRFN